MSSSSENETINPFVDEDERSGLLGDSSGDELSEEEPPPAKKAKISVSSETGKILKSAFSKSLKNDKRKVHTNKFPLPSVDCVHTPKLDEAISCLILKSAKTYDRYLSKMQQFSVDALGPLIWLNENLEGSPKAKEAVTSAIALMGNASAHLSTERRKSIMKHLNKDLRPLCDGKFPDRGPYLFGDGFGARAKSTADNIKALKGIKPKPGHFSGSGGSKGKQPQSRRNYSWGKNTAVFSRLGPSGNSGRSSYQKGKQTKKDKQ